MSPKTKKRLLSASILLLLAPPLLLLAVGTLLYVPAVQRWAVGQAVERLQASTGLNVELQRVRLGFPLDLELEGLQVVTPQADTLARLERMVAGLQLSHILQGQLRVEGVELCGVELHTGSSIPGTSIEAQIESLRLEADTVDLNRQAVALARAEICGGYVHLLLADTTQTDTAASTPLPWTFGVERISIERLGLALKMPADTLDASIHIGHAALHGGLADLPRGEYRARWLQLLTDSLALHTAPADTLSSSGPGLSYEHLSFGPASVMAEDAFFCQQSGAGALALRIQGLHEACGLRLDSLTARVGIDSTAVWADTLCLATPHSHLCAWGRAPLSALRAGGGGQMHLSLDGALHLADVAHFLPLPERLLQSLGGEALAVRLRAEGNADTLHLQSGRVEQTQVAAATLNATACGLFHWPTAQADVQWGIDIHSPSTLHPLVQPTGLRLPALQMKATASKRAQHYSCQAHITQPDGAMSLQGQFDAQQMAYQASLSLDNIHPDHFLPVDSLEALTARVELSGQGTDLFSPHTWMQLSAQMERVKYRHYTLRHVALEASLRQGQAQLSFDSDNRLLHLHTRAQAALDKQRTTASLSVDLDHIDLLALGLARDTLSAAMDLTLAGSTDFGHHHSLAGGIRGIQLQSADTVYHTVDLSMQALLQPDTMRLRATAGDMQLRVDAPHGYEQVMGQAQTFVAELLRQKAQYHLDQDTLRTLLPDVTLHLSGGRKNPMHNILHYATGYTFHRLRFDLDANPAIGLRGSGDLEGFHTGSVPVDTIRWHIFQDSTGVNLRGRVSNNRRNRVGQFESNLRADLTPTGLEAALEYFDARHRRGIDIGLRADIEPHGLRLSLIPEEPVIAYRKFRLNPDNFVSLSHDGTLQALVHLMADDGTGMRLYSTPNPQARHDVAVELSRINLDELTSVLPYLPRMSGVLQADAHYLLEDSTLTLSVDAQAAQFKYQGSPIGNVGLSAAYMPSADGTHVIDGTVWHEADEVLRIAGAYNPQPTHEHLDVRAMLKRLPLSLANGFVPDRMAQLSGFAHGLLRITGTPSQPVMNGAFRTEEMKLQSAPYSVALTFPDDTIRIRHNVLNLDRIRAFAVGHNPLVLDGTIDLAAQPGPLIDLGIRAQNYQLINASKTRDAQAWGKVYVDIGALLRGTPANLQMRGRLNVLGNTDVTYVLRDSPISANDEMAELVEFTDFADTIAEKQDVMMASPQRMDMRFGVNIEQAAQVHCLLSENGKDYVNLEGGGELTLSYDAQNNMQLTGRYTILEGDMSYSLMGLVSKHFNIQNGSYVEFHGNVANPHLHIQAKERVKSTVTEDNTPRSVNFDVGLQLSRTLEDMGLEFTLEAPEDMSIQNELATMGPEQRGRVAVTMLATGIYLTDNYKASGVSSTNALYNYLQSQVGAIAGKALSTVDVNFGIDNTINATGSSQTDYNFSFAKRFWGNRVRVVIGGKVSSGRDAVNNGQSIIDNVSLEYRLDNSATRYVKLYYDKNYESILEGELTEVGGGVVFRRKSDELGDLFIFRRKKDPAPRPTKK